jgi:hypothetical protein
MDASLRQQRGRYVFNVFVKWRRGVWLQAVIDIVFYAGFDAERPRSASTGGGNLFGGARGGTAANALSLASARADGPLCEANSSLDPNHDLRRLPLE